MVAGAKGGEVRGGGAGRGLGYIGEGVVGGEGDGVRRSGKSQLWIRPGSLQARSLQGLQRRIDVKRGTAVSGNECLHSIRRESGGHRLRDIQRAGRHRTAARRIDNVNLIWRVEGIGGDCGGSVV